MQHIEVSPVEKQAKEAAIIKDLKHEKEDTQKPVQILDEVKMAVRKASTGNELKPQHEPLTKNMTNALECLDFPWIGQHGTLKRTIKLLPDQSPTRLQRLPLGLRPPPTPTHQTIRLRPDQMTGPFQARKNSVFVARKKSVFVAKKKKSGLTGCGWNVWYEIYSAYWTLTCCK